MTTELSLRRNLQLTDVFSCLLCGRTWRPNIPNVSGQRIFMGSKPVLIGFQLETATLPCSVHHLLEPQLCFASSARHSGCLLHVTKEALSLLSGRAAPACPWYDGSPPATGRAAQHAGLRAWRSRCGFRTYKMKTPALWSLFSPCI